MAASNKPRVRMELVRNRASCGLMRSMHIVVCGVLCCVLAEVFSSFIACTASDRLLLSIPKTSADVYVTVRFGSATAAASIDELYPVDSGS